MNPDSERLVDGYLAWLRLQSYRPSSVHLARRVLRNFARALEPRSVAVRD